MLAKPMKKRLLTFHKISSLVLSGYWYQNKVDTGFMPYPRPCPRHVFPKTLCPCHRGVDMDTGVHLVRDLVHLNLIGISESTEALFRITHLGTVLVQTTNKKSKCTYQYSEKCENRFDETFLLPWCPTIL